MAKKSSRQFNAGVNEEMQIYEILVKAEQKYVETLNLKKNILAQQQKSLELSLEEQKYLTMKSQATKEFSNLSEKAKEDIELQLAAQVKIIGTLKKQVAEAGKYAGIWDKIGKNTLKVSSYLANIQSSLDLSDKPIRELALNLGISADNAQRVREAFYDATPAANILGAKMEDLRISHEAYSDQVGRTVALTGDELVNITKIAKGTSLGAEGAGALAGQFALMGKDVSQTAELVQGIVDSSERMGVNSNKVLKNMSANFSKLNTFAFKAGIDGMKKLAQYSEKFKIDMSSAIDSAGKARTLEGAIEMASQLQILGGEFTKSDPFELFHLSRNDPAKYTQKINEMTKGMASLVKTADGFEMQVSPMDLDRLKQASEALGVPFENLVEQSKQMGHYQKMNNQLVGKAFTKEQMETIHAMAKLDGKSGLYKVLGKNISDLTEKEVEALKTQQTTLENRAKASQTFDEKFQNTITSMKSTLLPMLEGINAVFDTAAPLLEGFGKILKMFTDTATGRWSLLIGGLVVGGGLLVTKLLGVANVWKTTFSAMGKAKDVASSAASGVGGSAGGGAGGGLAGNGALAKGAGVGAAAIGIGAGIAIAAVGIGKLAESMAKLDSTQIWALPVTVLALAAAMYAFVPAIIAVGTAGTVSAVGLVALGVAAIGIGAGIGIAATGIGKMVGGFSELFKVASAEQLLAFAVGIAAVGASMYALSAGSIVGLLAGGGTLGMLFLIASQASVFKDIGESFKNIGTVLNANPESLKQFKETLDSISNFKSNDSLSQIKDLFSKPLRVEFDKKSVAMNVDVSLKLDSDIVARSVAKKIVVIQESLRNGK